MNQPLSETDRICIEAQQKLTRLVRRKAYLAPADEDDLIQNIWVKIIKYDTRHPGFLDRLANQDDDQTWSLVAKVVGWKTTDWFREDYRHKDRYVAQQAESLHSVDGTQDGLSQAQNVEEAGIVREALAQLPAGRRQKIIMRFFDDMSPKEIAMELKKSQGTVGTEIKRALAQLGEAISELSE